MKSIDLRVAALKADAERESYPHVSVKQSAEEAICGEPCSMKQTSQQAACGVLAFVESLGRKTGEENDSTLKQASASVS